MKYTTCQRCGDKISAACWCCGPCWELEEAAQYTEWRSGMTDDDFKRALDLEAKGEFDDE